MESYAIHKTAIIAPRKARMTLDLIRGKKASVAMGILENTNTKASRLIQKVLKSAITNAVNNQNAKEDELFISECFINPGPTLKRIRPAAKGSAVRIRKRTSHITIVLRESK